MMPWEKGDLIQCDMVFTSQAAADAPDGFIKGIASTPSTDLYGHKVLKGAFDESIRKKGLSGPRGVKLLAGHNWHQIAGIIKKLETVGDNLTIEAQLNLNVSYVKDLHEVTKQNGGLNFSVGFGLKEYEFVDDDDIENEDDPWLIIKEGDLMEVSVVAFPAQLEAEMTFVKQKPPATMSEFERSLVARGLCRSRDEAHQIALVAKKSGHLFGKGEPSAQAASTRARPLLDAPMLKPAQEHIARMKAVFGSV
jgi:HK97 family phage prohead protease